MLVNADLLIVGAGAAGLFAACRAAEAGINAALLERRHRPGLKLLLSGNNRCNLSQKGSIAELLSDYGEPVASFIRPALQAFGPEDLRHWLAQRGLPTSVIRNRIYPRSGKADDVLHCFTDRLRDLELPLLLNCPVQKILPVAGGFQLHCPRFSLQSRFVLLCSGGVSYPKTGSVGDGQRMAGELGHRIEPYRPGLAGMEVDNPSFQKQTKAQELDLPEVSLSLSSQGRPIAVLNGNLLIANNCLRGSAIFDASRIIARQKLQHFELHLDLLPALPRQRLSEQLRQLQQSKLPLPELLYKLGLDKRLATELGAELRAGGKATDMNHLLANLKSLPLLKPRIRPLKEAIVTIGGVSLNDIDPNSMQSLRCPGLYFAGEVIDIDGPTGGYNLQAAFSSANLALQSIAAKLPTTKPIARESPKRSRGPRLERHQSQLKKLRR
ncbi:MAG: aminoacetone oxidase family FAD-binding enzyme [Oligosphaeraceae bacterium]|nr:aminoacetone oxidase family FAD-binding enzyme [Oligosphaeraceae bacterium]